MISDVIIPFRDDMAEAALNHRKYCTTRSRVYGVAGDRFKIRGRTFTLQHIHEATIGYVATNLYGFEGVESKEAFVALWNEIHTKRAYDELDPKPFFVHWFLEDGDKMPLLRCSRCREIMQPYFCVRWKDGEPYCSQACVKGVRPLC